MSLCQGRNSIDMKCFLFVFVFRVSLAVTFAVQEPNSGKQSEQFFGVVHALCPSVSLAEAINIDFVRWRCQEGFQTFFVSSRVVAQMHDLQIVAVSSSKLQGEALLQSMLRACCGEGFMNRSCSVIPCQRKESFSLPQLFFLVKWVMWSFHETGVLQLASIMMRLLLASKRGRVECCSE